MTYNVFGGMLNLAVSIYFEEKMPYLLSLYCTPCPEKGATLFLPVTVRNSNGFSKFFHHHALQ